MTIAVATYGSKLGFNASSSSGPFTTVAQLRKAAPQGSKQTIVDQTNILTAGNGDAPIAVRFAGGEIDISGVLSPQDGSQLTLGQLHANLTLAWWQLLLADGMTVWTFQGYVSEYVPWALDINKAVVFSAKIRISGAFTGPAGTA